MSIRKWLIYTVAIGLIPFLARLIIFIVASNVNRSFVVNAVDIVSFGLILNIVNISELESFDGNNPNWKTTQIGISLLLVVLFTLFLALAYLADADHQLGLSDTGITYCAGSLSVVSFVFSYSIFKYTNSQP